MGFSLTTLFLTTSLQFHLPPGLLQSLCWVESRHIASAVHKDDGTSDSIGICQIKLVAARQMGYKGTAQGLFNPKTNIFYAGKFLAHQIRRYHSVTRGVVAYNRGNARHLTTSAYQRKVFKIWKGKTEWQK